MGQAAPEFSEIFVLLAKGDGGKHIEIYINEHRLGTLTAADSADFLAILATADDGQPVLEDHWKSCCCPWRGDRGLVTPEPGARPGRARRAPRRRRWCG